MTTIVHLQGGGEEGLGEDVTYGADSSARSRRPARCCRSPGAGRSTRSRAISTSSTCSAARDPGMPAFRDYRRWAFESAAADLALRQAGRSLADVLGREPQPINFVVSLRLGDPPSAEPVTRRLAAYPGLQFKLDYSPAWDEELLATLAATGAVESIDFKGAYKGTPVDVADRSRALPPLRRDVPGGVAGGSRPDRPRGRRGAAPVPRPDHLGRADPRRRRHRGAAVPAADDQRQAVADRHLEEAAAHLRVVRRARHHQLRRRAVRAGRRARPDPVPRVDLPRRRAERHRALRLRLGRVPRRPACPPNPLPPEIEPTGFRRRS